MKRLLISTIAALAFAATSAPLIAQDGPDAVFAKGVAFLEGKKYAEAQDAFDGMIAQHGKNAMQDFGPRFGAVYYHRALAYQGQGKYQEAFTDFETTATQFANKPGVAQINPYQTISLLMAGFAQMQSKEPDHEKAMEYFKKFERAMATQPPVADRDNVVYNRAALWVNSAICEAKTGKPRNAAEFFKKLVTDEGGADRANRNIFEKTPQLVLSAALEIIDAFANSATPGDGVEFIEQNRKHLRSDPGILYHYAPRLLQIASESTKEGHYPLALAIYSITPTTREALEGLEAAARTRQAAPSLDGKLPAFGQLIKEIKDKLLKDVEEGTPIEAYALDGTARIFQLKNNFEAVYGVYRTLAAQFPKSKLRPEILYSLALAASVTGRLDETQKYGDIFIKEFPSHELRPRVEELMIEGMFWAGRYEDALRIASNITPAPAPGSKVADLVDFVIGGSNYFLGRYTAAAPLLKKHVETYKDSTHREMARFYQADNLARLNRFTEAGTKLDDFLRDYPDSSMLDLALYSRANVHYNLDQNEPAVSRLNQFLTKRPYSGLRDQAQNLFGNIFESQSKPEEAEASYRKAKETAETLGHDGVAAESIVYLMGLLADEEKRAADVAALYDEFFEKYPENPNRAKAAVIPLKALEKMNRIPDALKRLEEIIAAFGNNIEAVGLEDAIVSYVTYAEKGGMSLQELRDRLYNFPGLPADADVARPRLRMALIDLYEKKIREEKDDAKRANLQGEIEALFNALRRDFPIEKLSNYVLNRIGDNLMRNGRGDMAREYFDQVIKSPDVSFKDKAMFNIAVIYGESEQNAQPDKAIEMLNKVAANFGSEPGLKEKVTRQKAITYELAGKWDKVSETWLEYLRNKAWTRHQTEAYYFRALAQEKMGLWDDALVNYAQGPVLDPGNLLYSSPSFLRFAEIQYKEKSRRQEGYESLRKMMKLIGHLEEAEAKMLREDAPKLSPTDRRRLGDRLKTNYLAKARETLAAWEAAGGINVIVDDPKAKK
jgi:tetratricopeptide (TPR) repeat protein